ncbi:sensor histidine kinase [Methanothermobacter sp. THM-1]|nr:PAS domain S-box protein [Methanothermobacter sp. THM-1]
MPDIWWMVSYLILVLAAMEFFKEDWSRPVYSPVKGRITAYLPEIFVLLFYIMTTIAIFEVGGFILSKIGFAEEVIIAYGLIILLFTGRQHLSMKENIKLLENVESKRKTAEMYLDVAGSLIMVLDERDRVKLINRRGLEILEGERDEITGKHWFLTFVPPEDREWRLKLYQDHLKQGDDSYRLEGDILTLKGRRKTVSWNVRFLRENGELRGSIIAGDDITDIKKAREELEISEKRYRSIFEGAPVPIISLNHDGRVRDCNSATERVLEYSAEELQGMNMKDLMHPDDLKGETEGLGRLISRSGRLIYANIRVTSICDEEIVIIEDQTEIMESLREKELLLREIHHRVKNNLQIISSLLSIQERQIESRKLRNILAESRDRIRSIALVHEHLYHSTDLSTVSIRGYLENLISKITQGQTSSGVPRIHTSIEDLEFNLETSLPVGLIVNELVSNSLKHAEASNIYVELKGLNGEFELRVADDGRGVESPDVITGSRSMGWYLIRALIDQLDGEMDIETDGGLSIRIRFHELSYEKRY